MKMANPAPVGTLSFGLSCLVIGALFAGWFGPMNSGNMFAGAISALSSGLLILIVTFLTLNKNAVADSPAFSMWVGTIFGVFAQSWIFLGLVMFNWKDGVAKPLSFLLLFLSLICLGYLIYAIKLKARSFVFVFLDATISSFCAFLGLFTNWTLGSVIAGYGFIILSALTLYIVFLEQLIEILPRKQSSELN